MEEGIWSELLPNAYCRHVDVSSQRGNEAEIGAALSEVFSDWLVNRPDVWITGKVGRLQQFALVPVLPYRPALSLPDPQLTISFLPCRCGRRATHAPRQRTSGSRCWGRCVR